MFFPTEFVGSPWLFLGLLLLSSITSVFKVNLPLARRSSTMSVSYAVDFAALLLLGAERDDARRGGQRVQPVHVPHQGAQPDPPHAVQHGVPDRDGAGGRPASITARRPRRQRQHAWRSRSRWSGAATTYFLLQHADGRDGDRAVGEAAAVQGLERELPVERAELLRRRRRGGGGRVDLRTCRTSGSALVPLWRRRSTSPTTAYKVYLGRVEDERRHTQEMADLHLATIEALALAIDAKDQTSQLHIRRVQLYAAALARGLGMSENEIQGVKTAALLHDIGKLAVPEHILSKPGPLTPEEFQKIRAHPKVGADIVSSVPFPYPVAPLILSHHERWDGKGYPAGLKGEEIPLGARILSVVDYFDALMAERPYHKAMTFRRGDRAPAAGSGQGARPAGGRHVHRAAARRCSRKRGRSTRASAAPRRKTATPNAQPATGLAPELSKKNVFEDIALAHREIYALYEIAQAMGTSLGVSDTMALISAKLTNLVPFACAALFLYDEETETLRCRFATGTDADVIQQVGGPQRRRADRLGRAQPAAARQRAAERRSRGRGPDAPLDQRCSPRWSAR